MVLIGGLNFPAVRLSNRELAPFFGAGLRFASAAVLLYVLMTLTRIPLPTLDQLKGTLLYGLLGFAASYAFAYTAMVALPSGVAAVVMGSVPLMTLLLAVVQGVERFRLRGLVGAVIAITGIIVLVGFRSSANLPAGALLVMLGAALSAAESGIVLKKYPTGHPMATNAVAMGFGGALLIALALVSGERWSLPASAATWVSLAYLIVAGSIGMFALFLYTLKHWAASRVSYMFVLMPIVASISGAPLAGDAVTPAMVVGGLIVLSGVYVGALSGPKSTPPTARVIEEHPRASAPIPPSV
jgi:drug/metabolite transporter (DMT)-like permease